MMHLLLTAPLPDKTLLNAELLAIYDVVQCNLLVLHAVLRNVPGFQQYQSKKEYVRTFPALEFQLQCLVDIRLQLSVQLFLFHPSNQRDVSILVCVLHPPALSEILHLLSSKHLNPYVLLFNLPTIAPLKVLLEVLYRVLSYTFLETRYMVATPHPTALAISSFVMFPATNSSLIRWCLASLAFLPTGLYPERSKPCLIRSMRFSLSRRAMVARRSISILLMRSRIELVMLSLD